jgi:hypothetical protein
MPASLPGDTKANNTGGNPDAGRAVIFDLMSGPKGSPLDKDTAGNASTGALSTGIGFGASVVIGGSIPRAGFTDDYKPGISTPAPADAADSRFMYIGGGRTSATGATPGRPFPPAPFTAGFGIGGAGNGGSRDAGAGPAFTGFGLKLVTGAAAAGAAVEAGWVNRSGVALVAGQSTFGSAAVASAAPA